jgi:hypothetical protein
VVGGKKERAVRGAARTKKTTQALKAIEISKARHNIKNISRMILFYPAYKYVRRSIKKNIIEYELNIKRLSKIYIGLWVL